MLSSELQKELEKEAKLKLLKTQTIALISEIIVMVLMLTVFASATSYAFRELLSMEVDFWGLVMLGLGVWAFKGVVKA